MRRLSPITAGVLVATVVLAGCDDDGDEIVGPEPPPVPGVTDEPCPDAVDEDAGCIYLGTLANLVEEPDGLGVTEALAGQRAFWHRVNAAGGVGGHEVDVSTHVREVTEDPDEQLAALAEIVDDVLALAMIPGGDTSPPLLDAMDADDIVGVPASWWSGWSVPEVDHGLVLASGPSHCLASALALDWYVEGIGQPLRVLAVDDTSLAGADVVAGAAAWSEATTAEWLGDHQVGQEAIEADVDAVVQALMDDPPDVVLLGVGPDRTGEIVSKAAARGFQGTFLGSAGSFDAALLDDDEQAQALQALYRHVGPWEPLDGDSEAHAAMRDALGDEAPATHGYLVGWIGSYPLLAAIERAAATGTLDRAGVRAAVDGLEVAYEGALPPRTYGRPVGDEAHAAVISAPDPDQTLGLRAIDVASADEAVDALDLTRPCAPSR